jgi:hypothetical protein
MIFSGNNIPLLGKTSNGFVLSFDAGEPIGARTPRFHIGSVDMSSCLIPTGYTTLMLNISASKMASLGAGSFPYTISLEESENNIKFLFGGVFTIIYTGSATQQSNSQSTSTNQTVGNSIITTSTAYNAGIKSYSQEVIAIDGQTQIALNNPKGSYFVVYKNGIKISPSNWSVDGTTLTFNDKLSKNDVISIDSIS